jgi:hypothetical protein
MLDMSVNDVPGWLVTITPSGIGVPVATTPGLVPHCEVLTAAALAGAVALLGGALVLVLVVVLLVLLLHAAAVIAMAAASTTVLRAEIMAPRDGICPLICPPRGSEFRLA